MHLSWSKAGVAVAIPQGVGQAAGIGAHAKAPKMLANVPHVTPQQIEGVRVASGIYRLREVDDGDLPAPVQDVERRKVAMDAVMGQKGLHVAQHPLEQA